MNMDDMIQHSFRNFHVKGFDYLCVKRTPEHTRKVYFFDGNVSQLPEVVNPHDHRYHFKTTVLSGVMSNSVYVPDDKHGKVYNEFEWHTPLNGGDGFTWKRETRLFEYQRVFYRPGTTYQMDAEDFHTIRMHAEGTVIVLDQYDDIVPIGQPTRTFMQERQAPNLDGLYEKFTPDQLKIRLKQYRELLDT
ncbi:hypothetical protein [Mesorhizobium sp. B2-4-5]|uniref:hypothetical protein n=1 Tax=Mesorhizobium sp. B2-4-5 TaxID=2589944 RepID=UPI001128EA91|nr:hypothetical protein [Mesorhizobium sp. B2-4-5]TPL42588.1 hypothetical protein FJ961_07820 [Mesorhizobium sp. B2-4-5]